MRDPTASLKDKLIYNFEHQRRYASSFDWREEDEDHVQAKQVKERNATRCWWAARHHEAYPDVCIESCDPPRPDCALTDRLGRRLGVEVTELVDLEMVKSSQRKLWKLSHGREYTTDHLFAAVTKILERKERTFERHADLIRNEQYEKLVLIIHTAEPTLTPGFCRDSLVNRTLPKLQFIGEAFLLFRPRRMRHMNDREAWPCRVVQIPI